MEEKTVAVQWKTWSCYKSLSQGKRKARFEWEQEREINILFILDCWVAVVTSRVVIEDHA